MGVKVFRPKPSHYLAILLLIIHGGAIACLWVVPWPWWTKLLLVVAALVSFMTLFRQHVLLNTPQSIIEFWQQQGGHWQIKDNLSEIKTAKLADNSICTRYFVLLNFNCLNKRQPASNISVLVLSDSLNDHDFRRLRRQLQSMS